MPRESSSPLIFPLPMVEKNGSLDAFRFAIHPTTGGSDHICFNNPDVSKTQTLPRQQATAVLNYVNGKRSIAEIASCVDAELDEDVPLPRIAAYLELLKSAGCVVFDSAATSP